LPDENVSATQLVGFDRKICKRALRGIRAIALPLRQEQKRVGIWWTPQGRSAQTIFSRFSFGAREGICRPVEGSPTIIVIAQNGHGAKIVNGLDRFVAC
jgi:hypothetical protein